ASQAADLVLLPYLPSSPSSVEAALDLYRRCPDRLHRVFLEVLDEDEEGGEEGCTVEGIRQVLLLQGQGQPPASWLALNPSLPPSLKTALRRVGKVGKVVTGGGKGGRGGGERGRGRGSKGGWKKGGREGGREGGAWLSVGGVEVGVGTVLGVAAVMGLFVFVLKKQPKTR
ncbi:mitochondrial rho gtpase 1-like, partial [Nannochloropsis oceanica]